MKIIEKDGYKYSFERFDDYKIRCKFEIMYKFNEFIYDFYTTNENMSQVNLFLYEKLKGKVSYLNMIYWGTKSQDDSIAKFIDEFLK